MNQHEWSESGRELLRNFNLEIQRNGGLYKTYLKIKRESNKRIYRFKSVESNPSEDNIIFSNWGKVTVEKICELTGKRPTYVRKRARWLGLPDSSYKREYIGVIVLNIENGIYYETACSAAKSLNLNRRYLNSQLLGKRKNKTNFIKV